VTEPQAAQESVDRQRGDFNPDMLRLARGVADKNQEDLAKALGVSQGKVSKWEDSILVPSDDETQGIAAFLKCPRAFLYQQEQVYGFGSCCMYHRKRKAISLHALNSIHDRINVARIGIRRLLKNVTMEYRCQFEHLDVDEYSSAAEIAQLVRVQWQLPRGPVRSVIAVVEDAGGIVVPMDFGTSHLDAVSQWPRGMPPIFFINTAIPADRWRWSLVHEVAHIVMHRIPTPNAEVEADQFTSEFLLPEREIRAELSGMDLAKAARLKPRWRVSMQAIIRRAHDLGELTNKRYTSLFAYMSKLGYRKNEPQPIEPEKPTTIARLIDVHLNALGYTVPQLADLMFLDEASFRASYLDRGERLRVVG
jgi:Zn-dependent peptidase ImmA (M78 family)/DNA-binding XRE family transcriptional regulator